MDSEHSAIFQSLNGEHGNKIDKILLTASGGPFRGRKRADLENIQLEDALKSSELVHGTKDYNRFVQHWSIKVWKSWKRKWLFGTELEQIQVVVHPQSVIHSMVQYEDGAVIAQLGTPDMRLPIQYALYYPQRRTLSGKRLDFYELANLTFEKPDLDTFTGLKLAMEALKQGGNIPTAFNAANERAVAKFLDRKIRFLEIPEIIAACMEHCTYIAHPGVEEILDTEQAAYEYIEGRW